MAVIAIALLEWAIYLAITSANIIRVIAVWKREDVATNYKMATLELQLPGSSKFKGTAPERYAGKKFSL